MRRLDQVDGCQVALAVLGIVLPVDGGISVFGYHPVTVASAFTVAVLVATEYNEVYRLVKRLAWVRPVIVGMWGLVLVLALQDGSADTVALATFQILVGSGLLRRWQVVPVVGLSMMRWRLLTVAGILISLPVAYTTTRVKWWNWVIWGLYAVFVATAGGRWIGVEMIAVLVALTRYEP